MIPETEISLLHCKRYTQRGGTTSSADNRACNAGDTWTMVGSLIITSASNSGLLCDFFLLGTQHKILQFPTNVTKYLAEDIIRRGIIGLTRA